MRDDCIDIHIELVGEPVRLICRALGVKPPADSHKQKLSIPPEMIAGLMAMLAERPEQEPETEGSE